MFLDSSYLVDLARGHEAAVEFYEDNEQEAFATSTVVAYELFGGLVESGADDRLDELRRDLDWVKFADFTLEDAHEAAKLDAELFADGERIPVPDVLIAAATRSRGEVLVAADDHFDRVDSLDYVNYRA